jgi:hypothetical protein
MTHNILGDLLYSIFPQQDKYLTYGIGNSPIILSAPHGGNIKPISIPKRTWGNRSRDTYTRRLIQRVIELLPDKPYYIYSNIHRNRVDLNRDFEEATQGNKSAEKIWSEWNITLDKFKTVVSGRYGRGLYIDIHSHNNSSLFQIGYGLKVKDYLDLKGGWETRNHSTLHPLVDKDTSEKSLCFGYNSIISNLEYNGYNVLVPKEEAKYLNGGRNIREFHGKGIGAIQVECPIPILKKDLDRVARALANSIISFRQAFL